MDSQSKEVIFPLYLALLWPHLKCFVQFWALQYKKGIKILESIQRIATNLAKVLESASCEEGLRMFGCSV